MFPIKVGSCATRSSQRANLGFLFSSSLHSATIFLDGRTMTWFDHPKRLQRKTCYCWRDFRHFVGDTGGPPISLMSFDLGGVFVYRLFKCSKRRQAKRRVFPSWSESFSDAFLGDIKMVGFHCVFVKK
jgi:hypothetical protein